MAVLAEYARVLAIAAIPIGVLFALERLFPLEKQPLRPYLFNLLYFLAALLVIMHLSPPLMRVQAAVRAVTGTLHVPAIEPLWAKAALGLGLVFVWDFFYYWAHRAMHAWPFLWQVHKLHHSDLVLNSLTSQRIHIFSYVLGAFVVTLPIQILFDGFTLPTVLAIVFFNGLAYFNHANLRLSMGFLTPVLTGPQLHRIHHSALPEHHGRNLAAFFPLLDIVFGTYHRPRADEWPRAGLASREDMNDLRSVTIAPLVSWLRPDGREDRR